MSSMDGRLDVLGRLYHPLLGPLVSGRTTAKPDCDVGGQDALHYTSVKVHHDDVTHACFFKPSQEV